MLNCYCQVQLFLDNMVLANQNAKLTGPAHNSHGKLGLIVEQANINEVRGMHVVYICTSVLMNYECI
jgi:hypothetical protein